MLDYLLLRNSVSMMEALETAANKMKAANQEIAAETEKKKITLALLRISWHNCNLDEGVCIGLHL